MLLSSREGLMRAKVSRGCSGESRQIARFKSGVKLAAGARTGESGVWVHNSIASRLTESFTMEDKSHVSQQDAVSSRLDTTHRPLLGPSSEVPSLCWLTRLQRMIGNVIQST